MVGNPIYENNNDLNDNINKEDVSKIESADVGDNRYNIKALGIISFLFGAFVICEIIGALASNSLSLLGDAAAMSVDVFSYFANMYAERIKSKHGELSIDT